MIPGMPTRILTVSLEHVPDSQSKNFSEENAETVSIPAKPLCDMSHQDSPVARLAVTHRSAFPSWRHLLQTEGPLTAAVSRLLALSVPCLAPPRPLCLCRPSCTALAAFRTHSLELFVASVVSAVNLRSSCSLCFGPKKKSCSNPSPISMQPTRKFCCRWQLARSSTPTNTTPRIRGPWGPTRAHCLRASPPLSPV